VNLQPRELRRLYVSFFEKRQNRFDNVAGSRGGGIFPSVIEMQVHCLGLEIPVCRSAPHFASGVHHETQLSPLLVFGQQISFVAGHIRGKRGL